MPEPTTPAPQTTPEPDAGDALCGRQIMAERGRSIVDVPTELGIPGASPNETGGDVGTPAFTWAESVASTRIGPTAQIDIDIHAPGQAEPVPVEIPLAEARTLHAMLGDLLSEHDEPAPSTSRDTMRDAIATALRAAAYHCDGDCGLDEPVCDAAHAIRVDAWAHEVVSDISGPVQAIAAAIDTVFEQWATGLGETRPQDALTDAVMGALDAGNLEPSAARSSKPAADLNHGLREAITAIVQRVPGNGRDEYDLTTAVLAVRDGEMEQLRVKVRRLTSDLAETAGLEETAADRYQNALHWQERAEEAEATVADYENRITWETTCGEHAKLLDACRAADEAREEAEDKLAAASIAARRVRAYLAGFADVLDLTDRGPWANTVGAALTDLDAALTAPAGRGDGGGK
jgi:hypothetical protein